MVVMAGLGLLAFKTLKYNFFPELPVNIISVQVVYPGASPEEVEQGIVYKIEESLKGVRGIDRVSSSSKENSASVTIELIKGENADNMLQEVKNAIDKISTFPTTMEPPIVFKRENRNFAISFALSGDADLFQLKAVAQQVENELLSKDGISEVVIAGFPKQEIEISVDEETMRAYNLSFDDVSGAIQRTNLDITGGLIKTPREEFIIRAVNKTDVPLEFEKIIIKALPNGNIIRLGDIAKAHFAWQESPSRSYLNGKPSVTVTVNTSTEEDIIVATDIVGAYLIDFNEANEFIKTEIIRDGSINLRKRIELLVKNGWMGALIVLVVLALFLHYRIAFWVALGIPVSFLGMFILFAWYGMTINVISLFGMIIVIGILVDDGVVISENIYRYSKEGHSRTDAAIKGTIDVFPSIVSAILTTIAIFSIFFFLEGRVGEIFSDISFVVISTLAISLIDALFILPSHIAHSKALDKEHKPFKFQLFMDKVMQFMIHKMYAPVLRTIIKNKIVGVAISLSILFIMLALISANKVKQGFFPVIEQDNVNITVNMPYGTREMATKARLDQIEAAIWRVNENALNQGANEDIILNVEQIIGPDGNQGRINAILRPGDDRSVSSSSLIAKFRKETGEVKGAENVAFSSASPFGKPVSLTVMGTNIEEMRGAKDMLVAFMEDNTENLKDVTDDDIVGKKEIRLQLTEKAKSLGLSLSQVMGEVRKGFFGSEVQSLQIGTDEVKVWVRYDEAYRSSLKNLENIRIRVSDKSYPLHEMATYSIERGSISINHIDRQRVIKIDSELAHPKVSAPEQITDIEDNLLPQLQAQFPGVLINFEGQNREKEKMAKSMGRALPILLIIMLTIIAFVFRSVSQTIAVFLLIPFSFSGVIFGHFMHDTIIGILSMLGIIALIGVLVNDSLVFVSTYNMKLKEGKKIKNAIYETGLQRFQPILLTTVTTVAGIMPIIFERSTQAQFLIPMAIALAYGLAFATLLTLTLLPSLLLVMNDIKFLAVWLWDGKKPDPTSLEASVKESKRLAKNDN